jgi:hypothetical protein
MKKLVAEYKRYWRWIQKECDRCVSFSIAVLKIR